MVRLLHTSDWHLGRKLCGASLLDDQSHLLDQVLGIGVSERVDALIVAGDVYDRAVPPEDAVRLFSDFLARWHKTVGVPIVAISGNHDSADRFGFAAAILAKGRVFLRSRLDERTRPVLVEGRGQRAHIYCLPYADPEQVRLTLGVDDVRGHDAAVTASLAAVHEHRQSRRDPNTVLVGHLFAQGGVESRDSERSLVVGGVATVRASALDGFAYVALGHLHRAQRVAGRDDVRYSGSLGKYAFSESTQQKEVVLVEIGDGRAEARSILLTPRRDLVRIEGRFDELLRDPRFVYAEGAYVEATYTDATYLIDVMPRLRERFGHVLQALPSAIVATAGAHDPLAVARQAGSDYRELLAGFWQHVGAGELAPAQIAAFAQAIETVASQVPSFGAADERAA